MMWLAYLNNFIGESSNRPPLFRSIFTYFEWATGLDQTKIQMLYNLTATQVGTFSQTAVQSLNIFQLDRYQALYLPLNYVQDSLRSNYSPPVLTQSMYVGGVTYMNLNVEMQHLLYINNMTREDAINSTVINLVRTFYGNLEVDGVPSELEIAHGLSEDEINKLKTMNITTEFVERGAFFDSSTLSMIMNFTLGKGEQF